MSERDAPIDDDEIRDLLVVRTARRECTACAGAHRHDVAAVWVDETPRVVTGPVEVVGGTFRYPWCGMPTCDATLVGHLVLGRLPHQSAEPPRARWIEVDGVWSLEFGDWSARVERKGLGWAAYLSSRPGSWLQCVNLQQAQTLSEYTLAEVLLGRVWDVHTATAVLAWHAEAEGRTLPDRPFVVLP